MTSSSSRRTSPDSSTTGGSKSLPAATRCTVVAGVQIAIQELVCLCLPRPFRRVTDKGSLLWDRIHRLEKGKIYKQVFVLRSVRD